MHTTGDSIKKVKAGLCSFKHHSHADSVIKNVIFPSLVKNIAKYKF